jgi:hypothetical protein
MKLITPEQLAASGSEDGEQLALMCWCALNFDKYPELRWLAHVPNGGFRDKREAAKLKAMGVKPGFPDLILLVKRGEYSGILIEMKKLKKGVVRLNQTEWGKFLTSNGFGFKVCYGWIDAKDTLVSYLEWK